jgi:antitoxin component YwqK of YwqJK toxin-antitoxin module
LLEGVQELFYPDGTPEAVYNCSKGMFEGEYVKYRNSGKVKEKMQFLHDQAHGNRYLYDTAGNPMPGEKYWSGSFTGFIR